MAYFSGHRIGGQGQVVVLADDVIFRLFWEKREDDVEQCGFGWPVAFVSNIFRKRADALFYFMNLAFCATGITTLRRTHLYDRIKVGKPESEGSETVYRFRDGFRSSIFADFLTYCTRVTQQLLNTAMEPGLIKILLSVFAGFSSGW